MPIPTITDHDYIVRQPDFLKTHQVDYGHAIRYHVGKTTSELIDRKLTPKKDGSFRPATSSFRTEKIYQDNIVGCIFDNKRRIFKWLEDPGAPKRMKIISSTISNKQIHCGEVIYRNEEKRTLEKGYSNQICVELTKDGLCDIGYRILTGYAGEKGLISIQADITKEMKDTATWKNCSKPYRAELLRAAQPNPQYELYRLGPKRNGISVWSKEEGIRCDITEDAVRVCLTDAEGRPKPYGLIPKSEKAYDLLSKERLQSHLSKTRPYFLEDTWNILKAYDIKLYADTYKTPPMPKDHTLELLLKQAESEKKRGGQDGQDDRRSWGE